MWEEVAARRLPRGLAELTAELRLAEEAAQRAGEGVEIAGVGDQDPLVPVVDLVGYAAAALATTGRPFHIASVTVRPKPSARLFWTTTAASRSRQRMALKV